MSDPALLGLPRTITLEGVDYPALDHTTRTFAVEAEFVRWVESQAYLAIERHRELLGLEQAEERRAGWVRDCASRVYAWTGEACIRARFSLEGVAELAYLQLAAGHAAMCERGQVPRHVPPDRNLVDR